MNIWPSDLKRSNSRSKVRSKNAILNHFKDHLKLYTIVSDILGRKNVFWPCDLERSKFKVKGQTQGHTQKFLKIIPECSYAHFWWFFMWPWPLSLKVTAKNAILHHFRTHLVLYYIVSDSWGHQTVFWPHDLERSKFKVKGQTQGHT